MRRLAACLLLAALLPGCGGSNAAKAPAPTKVQAAGSSGGSAGVAAAPVNASPATLCASEGKAKVKGKSPFAQCVSSLAKLNKGKAANPSRACQGMSKKKTKGTAGKSPFAVCVTAAARLMASKSKGKSTGKGKGKGSGSSGAANGSQDSTSTDTTSADGTITCFDAAGNEVDPESDLVDSCTDPSDTSASDSTAQGSSADTTDSSGDSSGDTSTDTSTDSTDSGN